MADLFHIQPSFGGGELAPAIAARVDIAKYHVGLARCENLFVHPHGGVSNRAGTKFVAETKDSSKRSRLIRFQFSVFQQYILEFGDKYIRVIFGDGNVIHPATTFDETQIVAGQDGARVGLDATTAGMGYISSPPPLGVVKNEPVQKFYTDSGSLVLTLDAAGLLQDHFDTLTVYDEAYVELGTLQTSAAVFSGGNTWTWASSGFAFVDGESYIFRAIYPNPNVGQVVEIASPWSEDQLFDIRWTQSYDVMTLVHPDEPPYELRRYDNHIWTLNQIQFEPLVPAPQNVAASGSGSGSTTYEYVVTAIDNVSFEESRVSDVASVASKPDTDWDNTVTWDLVARAGYYNVYRKKNGLFGYVGRADEGSFNDKNIDPDTDDTAPEYRQPFSGPNRYPQAVEYHQQRRIFGGSLIEAQTVWMTQTGNFYNFQVSTPSRPDDAITLSVVAGQANEVRHFVSLRDLIVLTSGGEWLIATDNKPLTLENLTINPQSYRGSTKLRPITIGNTIIYMQQGDVVRDLGYEFATDSYTGSDLSVLAKHLFDKFNFTDWTYCQAPYSLIWLIRNDGTLLGLTYMREHQVWAWHRHTTQGTYESVAENQIGEEDLPYFIVNRTINGQTKRYVERQVSRFFTTEEDMFFVDCGLTYEGPPATVISGLDHLEGAAVAVLADGNVVEGLTVESGSITIPNAASKVHVGLGYVSDMETMNIDFGTGRGTIQGKRKKLAAVTIRVEDTRAIWYGVDRDNMYPMKMRELEPYDTPVMAYTGDKRVPLASGFETQGAIVLQNRDPVTFNVLAVIPEVDMGDEADEE